MGAAFAGVACGNHQRMHCACPLNLLEQVTCVSALPLPSNTFAMGNAVAYIRRADTQVCPYTGSPPISECDFRGNDGFPSSPNLHHDVSHNLAAFLRLMRRGDLLQREAGGDGVPEGVVLDGAVDVGGCLA